jgi:hypothetical protein
MRGFHEGSIRSGRLLAILILMVIGVLMAGCGGGGSGGEPIEPQPCSITGVSTGTESSWLAGLDGPANLRWSHTGSAAAVRIELLKAGVVVATVAASTPNDGFYAWTPATGGQPNGSDFGLRVTALGETGCAGEKTGLTLTDVTGCNLAWTSTVVDSLTAGQSTVLTWTGGNTSDSVDIELWQDDLGGEPQLVGVVVAGTPDDGSYTWNPIDSFNFGTNDWFELHIADAVVPGCEAVSDVFRLVDNVNCACTIYGISDSASFTLGQTVPLTVSQEHGNGLVILKLMAGAEPVPGGTIVVDIPVEVAWDWAVSDYGYTGADRTKFHVKAIDATDGYCVGISDVFSIR